jgi:uncharacterized protein with von Willebrand factor type A (vWA) domain
MLKGPTFQDISGHQDRLHTSIIDRLSLLGELNRSRRSNSRLYKEWTDNPQDVELAHYLLEGAPPVVNDDNRELVDLVSSAAFEKLENSYRKEKFQEAKHELVIFLSEKLGSPGNGDSEQQEQAEQETGEAVRGGAIAAAVELTEDEVEDAEKKAAFIRIAGEFATDDVEFEDVSNMADDGTVDLSYLLDCLGWSRQAISHGTRTRPTRGAISGISSGDWSDATAVARLELVQGSQQRLLQLAESSLPNYDRKESEDVGLGPVIWCSDYSLSMRGNEPTVRALEMGVADSFNRQNRDLVGISFNSNVLIRYTWGESFAERFNLSGDEAIYEPGMKHHLRRYSSGGTNIRFVFNKALETATEYAGAPDIVLLTDGAISTPAETREALARFRERGGRVVAVLIGAQDVDEASRELFDAVVTLQDLRDKKSLSEVLELLATPAAGQGMVVYT